MLTVTAPLQTCVGVPSACEAAVHGLNLLYQAPDVEGELLVDASNAFNALNRKAALHNVPRICPALGRIFTNTYQAPSRLFVTGGGDVLSCEGTCQGDPLAMAVYAVATTPLIKHLATSCPTTAQAWYADDDAAADHLEPLRQYWEEISNAGPGYGYFPNASKTVLLVKPENANRARELFADTGIPVSSSGSRYLGGALGEDDFCRDYIMKMAGPLGGGVAPSCWNGYDPAPSGLQCLCQGSSQPMEISHSLLSVSSGGSRHGRW